MTQSLNYLFNIGGNFSTVISGITEATGKFSAEVTGAQGAIARLSSKMAALNVFVESIGHAAQGLQELGESGIALDTSLTDLSALTGLVGDDLRRIEGYAREAAKTFGVDAAEAVESYKMVLGQLSPELSKSPEALKMMGEHIATLSKLMGGDATASAEALNTAMNQYGVDLSDPIAAAQKMGEMMNVMAAAAREGSAEVPQIKAALEQAGMTAKTAGVSFEEANAAIQVLDKAGKKGSEGGVALRNVMATLAQGRFLPKDVLKELQATGINVGVLTDKSRSLSERLRALTPVMQDGALMSKLFGKENSAAALALVGGVDLMQEYTTAITGTTSAQDQAQVVMGSYAERQARIKQSIEDLKISFFSATSGFSLWASAIGEGLIPLAQLAPLGQLVTIAWTGLRAGFLALRTTLMAQVVPAFLAMRTQAVTSLMTMRVALHSGRIASFGFAGSIVQATLAVVRFATVGLWQGIKALGAYLLSLVTGGAASATFAATSATAFAAFKTSAVVACRAVSAAITSIPLVGWIAIAITAIGALGAYLWNTSVRFRAGLKGFWAYTKALFLGVWELAKNVFGAIGDLITAAFSLDTEGMSAAMDRMSTSITDFGVEAAKAFIEAYNQEMSQTSVTAPEQGTETSFLSPTSPGGLIPQPTQPTGLSLGSVGSSASSSDGGKIRNVTISIDRLVERFEIHTTNLQGDLSRVKDMVADVLLSAVNDVNLAH